MIPRNTVFTKLACLFHIIVNISFSYDLFIRKLQVLKNQMLEAHHLISSLISPVTIYRSQHSCAVTQVTSLHKIHESLCHPGITRLFHFVRAKNLPFSVEDVRKTVGNCRVCSESKPQFYTPPAASLVKATQPFERLSLDFKGPLPSTSKNRYLLTIVVEFSRFPFAFLCRSTDAKTVIECLNELFSVFGMCAYMHSDCGPAFLSNELVSYLHRRGIACSGASVYNPRGNGQCERYNGIAQWQRSCLDWAPRCSAGVCCVAGHLRQNFWCRALKRAYYDPVVGSSGCSRGDRFGKHFQKCRNGEGHVKAPILLPVCSW